MLSKRTLLVATVLTVVMGAPRGAAAQEPELGQAKGELTLSLEELFRTADEHNTSIQSFQSAIQEAEAGIEAAKAERLPDVDASVAFSYLGGGRITDRNFTNGFGVHIPHYGNNFALQASWAVYTGGAIQSGINLSKLAAEMAKANATDNQQRVRMLLTGYYLQLHNLRNQERVFDENIALTETLIAHTQKRQSEGVVLRNDITRYELQMESLKLGRTQVQNQAKIINHQLLTALGVDKEIDILPTEAFGISEDYKSLKSPEYLDYPGTPEKPEASESFWQSEATMNAPALQLSQLGIEMSEEKVRLEKSARRPTVAVVAEEHLDGPITVEIPNLNKNLNYFFVGVGVKYRFGSLYKNNKKVRQAQLATETAREQHQTAIEGVENAVQAAYVNYQTSFTELETSRKSVELAEQNYEVIHNRYQNGLALVTDMVDAANQRLDAQLRLVNSRISVLYNYYNLKYITGTL